MSNHTQALILAYQRVLLRKVNQIMATLADVQAALTAQTTATDALIALTDSVATQLAALIASGTGVTSDQLQAIIDASSAETAKINADLVKNKPAGT